MNNLAQSFNPLDYNGLYCHQDHSRYSNRLIFPPSCNFSLQIRHASLERLLERLLDIRFLSADFLNTFLITYRVYTSASALLDTLLQFYYSHNAKDYPLYLATDVFSPVSRKVRSVSLPTEALSPRQDKKKGNTMLLQ